MNRLQISRHWFRASFGVLIAVGLGLLIGLPVAAHLLLPGDEWLGILGLVPFCGGGIAMFLIETRRDRQAAVAFAMSAALFMTLGFGIVADRVSRHQTNGVLLNAISDASANPRVASFGLLEPSWVFYGGRPVDELSDPDVGFPVQAWIQRDNKWVAKPQITVDGLVGDGEDVFIITTEQFADILCEKLPGHYGVIAATPYFLKKGQLVVVGAQTARSTARRQSPGGSALPR